MPNRTLTIAAAWTAAAGLVIEWLLQLVHPQPDAGWQPIDRVTEACFALSLLASLVALTWLPRRLDAGVVGRVGAVVAQVGFAAMTAASLFSLVAGQNVLGTLFAAGLGLQVLGLLVLAIAGLVRPGGRVLATVPFLGLLLSVVVPVVGALVFAVAWVVVAVDGMRATSAGTRAQGGAASAPR